jgi:hypothetical protein
MLCKIITIFHVFEQFDVETECWSLFRCLSWCNLTQGWSTNPTEVHEEKMTTPDYCCVAPSLMGLTPISRPPAQCLNLIVAIELVKHLSLSGREYCEPLELIVPSSSCVFTLSRLTAIYKDRCTTFIFSTFHHQIGTTLNFHSWLNVTCKGKNQCHAVVCFKGKARLMLTLLVPCSQMWNEFHFIASELLKLNWFSF